MKKKNLKIKRKIIILYYNILFNFIYLKIEKKYILFHKIKF